MADVDEDAPLTSQTQDPADIDLADEVQDFRFLKHLAASTSNNKDDNPTIPRRGEKDFEPDGTNHQLDILAESRAALRGALSGVRVHSAKAYVRGVWKPELGLAKLERGGAKGTHFRVLGKEDKDGFWLLPEETLYLVERGALDLFIETDAGEGEEGGEQALGLQDTYAWCLSTGDGLTLERYQIYAQLKRLGYVVSRADTWLDEDDAVSSQDSGELLDFRSDFDSGRGIFGKLFAFLMKAPPVPNTFEGPLVQPGLYRTWVDIYARLAIVPHSIPSQRIPSSKACKTPFRVAYNIWKPNTPFKKSAPPPPDFRLAVVDARIHPMPTLHQISAMLASSPDEPPPFQNDKGKTYQKLKHGHRSVILAVVDQGVSSYLRLSDACFAEEKLYERIPVRPRTGEYKGKKAGGKRGNRKN